MRFAQFGNQRLMMFQNHRVSIKAERKMKGSAFSQCSLLEEAEHLERKQPNSLNAGSHIQPRGTLSKGLASFPSCVSLQAPSRRHLGCQLREEVEKVWRSQDNLKDIEQRFVDSSDEGSQMGSDKASGNKITKGSWTKEEDEHLIGLVKQNGAKNWSSISRHLAGRIGKQCRERWHNHLNPDIKKHKWTEEEDQLIIEYHRKFGNKWALISRYLPGRTDNAIKNHWNSTICRKISQSKHPEAFTSQINSNFFTPNKPKTDREWNTDLTHHLSPRLELFSSAKKLDFDRRQTSNLRVIIPLFTAQTFKNNSSSESLSKIGQLLGLDRIQ